jgi:hypothetical protein
MVPPTSNSSMHVRRSDNKIWSGTLQKRNKNVAAELNIYFHLFIIEFNQLPVVR